MRALESRLPPKRHLIPEWRQALQLLASSPHGATDDLLALAHGFDRAIITSLVHQGLATTRHEIITAPGRTTIQVVRVKISDAGRRVLEG
jgi:hypothetical protein